MMLLPDAAFRGVLDCRGDAPDQALQQKEVVHAMYRDWNKKLEQMIFGREMV